MKKIALVAVLWALFPLAAEAQKYAPVWDSYLTEISVDREERLALGLEFRWKKSGGPQYHSEHQCYLLAYLEKNDALVKSLCKDKELLNKKDKQKLLLNALQEKKLAVIVGVSIGQKHEAKQRSKPTDLAAKRLYHRRRLTYPFQFTFDNQKLWEKVSELPGFDRNPDPQRGYIFHEEKFRLLAFIPSNDSSSADKVSEKVKGKFDFTHFYNHESVAQYLRPLPYFFQFKRIPNGEMLIYVD